MAKTFVMVVEGKRSTDRSVTEFDHSQDAARFIEGLLEKGVEQENIRVMVGENLNVRVIQKPVVTLVPLVGAFPAPVEVMAASNSRTESDLVSEASESSEPYTRDGTRFSDAFAGESLGQRSQRTRSRYGPFIQQPA